MLGNDQKKNTIDSNHRRLIVSVVIWRIDDRGTTKNVTRPPLIYDKKIIIIIKNRRAESVTMKVIFKLFFFSSFFCLISFGHRNTYGRVRKNGRRRTIGNMTISNIRQR